MDKGRCKQTQNGALNLAEIRHQNGHDDHMGHSLPQLCSDQPHATFSLRQTESALHFHTLALIPIVLSLVSGFTLLRAPQSWAGKTKTFLPGSKSEPGRDFIRGLDLDFPQNNGRHECACHYQCGSVFLPSVAYFMERARNAAICALVQAPVGSNLPPPTPVVMPFSMAHATACA